MRLRIVFPVIAIALVLGFVVKRLLGFRQLFYEHAGIALTQAEIAQAHTSPDPRTPVIPKIIHNVYHNWKSDDDTVPSDWDGIRKNCIKLNEGWEFKVFEASVILRMSVSRA